MKGNWLTALLFLSALGLSSGAVAEESPLIKQMYDGGWPSAKEAESVHEQFLLQRAVQSYMMTLPALNVIGPARRFGEGVRRGLQCAANLERPHGCSCTGADAQR